MKKAIFCMILLCMISSCCKTVRSDYLTYWRSCYRQKIEEINGPLDEYVVSLIHIKNPRVIKISDIYYVMPDSTVKAYNGSESTFIKRKDVFKVRNGPFDRSYYANYRLFSILNYSMDILLEKEKEKDNIAVYKFKEKPKSFILALERHETIIWYDDVGIAEYSKEYYPTVAPVFSMKITKKINKQLGWDTVFVESTIPNRAQLKPNIPILPTAQLQCGRCRF